MQHEILARLFLIAVALLPLIWLIAIYRRQHFSLIQFGLWVAAHVLVRVQWRAKLPGLPKSVKQGAVIVCNHRSSVDPFFLQVCFDRPTHWMVAREYCEHPAFRWFLKQCEVIPVNRGGVDTAATKAAIRLAAEGGIIGMFPEGRINQTDGFMLPVRPGAILVALKARVPLVPCYIEGAPFGGTPWSPFFRTAAARIVFGPPTDLSPDYETEHDRQWAGRNMLDVAKKIAALAGQPDAAIRLAGRNWKPTEEELQAAAAAAQHR